jgi:hypothetical protein
MSARRSHPFTATVPDPVGPPTVDELAKVLRACVQELRGWQRAHASTPDLDTANAIADADALLKRCPQ